MGLSQSRKNPNRTIVEVIVSNHNSHLPASNWHQQFTQWHQQNWSNMKTRTAFCPFLRMSLSNDWQNGLVLCKDYVTSHQLSLLTDSFTPSTLSANHLWNSFIFFYSVKFHMIEYSAFKKFHICLMYQRESKHLMSWMIQISIVASFIIFILVNCEHISCNL